jgi:hypothetical protein
LNTTVLFFGFVTELDEGHCRHVPLNKLVYLLEISQASCLLLRRDGGTSTCLRQSDVIRDAPVSVARPTNHDSDGKHELEKLELMDGTMTKPESRTTISEHFGK